MNKKDETLIVPVWLMIKKGEERRFAFAHPPSDSWRRAQKGYQIFRVDVLMPKDWDDDVLPVQYESSTEETAEP